MVKQTLPSELAKALPELKDSINNFNGNESYVIADPSGFRLARAGKLLRDKYGYKVKQLNLVDTSRSCGYNPFRYLKTEADAMALVECLLRNTEPLLLEETQFNRKLERLLLEALVLYLTKHRPEEERTFSILACMASKPVRDHDSESGITILDGAMNKVIRDSGRVDEICAMRYKLFRQAAGPNQQQIFDSVENRLSIFHTDTLQTLTARDEMGLDRILDEPTAIFVVTPEGFSPYRCLAGIFYMQMADALYRCMTDMLHAESEVGLSLWPYPQVLLLLDHKSKIRETNRHPDTMGLWDKLPVMQAGVKTVIV